METTKRNSYMAPFILQTVRVRLELSLLASIVDNAEVIETAGQKIDGDYDYSTDSSLNHDWGNVSTGN